MSRQHIPKNIPIPAPSHETKRQLEAVSKDLNLRIANFVHPFEKAPEISREQANAIRSRYEEQEMQQLLSWVGGKSILGEFPSLGAAIVLASLCMPIEKVDPSRNEPRADTANPSTMKDDSRSTPDLELYAEGKSRRTVLDSKGERDDDEDPALPKHRNQERSQIDDTTFVSESTPSQTIDQDDRSNRDSTSIPDLSEERFSALAPLILPQSIREIPESWKEALIDPKHLVQDKFSEYIQTHQLSCEFFTIKGVTDEIAKDNSSLTITGALMLNSEFLKQLGIELGGEAPLRKIALVIDVNGKATVQFDQPFNTTDEISKALSGVLKGKSVKVQGLPYGELAIEITNAEFDGENFNIHGKAEAVVGQVKVSGIVTIELPSQGGKPRLDFKLDEDSRKSLEESVIKELKGSKAWKDAIASVNNFVKSHAVKYLQFTNGMEGYLSVESPKDSIDKSKKELQLTGDVYILPKFFELLKVEVKEKIQVGILRVTVDEKGRSKAEFETKIRPDEAISQALAKALVGKTVNVNGIVDRPIVYTIQSASFEKDIININGTVSYRSGKVNVAGTLETKFNVKNGKLDTDLKIDEAAARQMALAYLSDSIPNTPFGKISVTPDPKNRGVLVAVELDFYGMKGVISNVLVTNKGNVETSEATVKLGSNVTMTFGYFMLSRVEGAYDLNTKELTLGGTLTVTGDASGTLISVDGITTISLSNPRKIRTNGTVSILTIPAGTSETVLDLDSGRLETKLKIGNGNTKIEGHAIVQAPMKNTPWKIELAKAKVEVLELDLAEGSLLINDDGFRMSTSASLFGATATVDFKSDKELRSPELNVKQELKIKADLGDIGSVTVEASVSLSASTSGVKGKVRAETKWGSISVSINSRRLSELSLKNIEQAIADEIKKLIGDPLEDVRKAVEKGVEDTKAEVGRASESVKKGVGKAAEDTKAEIGRSGDKVKKGAAKAHEDAKGFVKNPGGSVKKEGERLKRRLGF